MQNISSSLRSHSLPFKGDQTNCLKCFRKISSITSKIEAFITGDFKDKDILL